MALLTDEQLHAIRELIRDHHSAFVVNTVGPEAVPSELLEKLQGLGLVDVSVESIEDAYLYGQAMASAQGPELSGMSLQEFKRHIRQNPIPLSDPERRAIDFAKHQAAQYVVGLGNRVDTVTGQLLIEADRALAAERRGQIRTATADAIAKRKSIKQLVSDLKWQTKDWTRDWDRIAITEKHNAMQRGTADGLLKRYGGGVLVSKRPTPDACFRPGTKITTRRGLIPVEEVVVGDKVLTHRMRWRPVVNVMSRPYDGLLYGFNGSPANMTGNHPVLSNLNWVRADSVQRGDYLVAATRRVAQDNPPQSLKDRFLANVSDARLPIGMPISAIDLYSHLQRRDSDIDVVFVDSQLRNGAEVCKRVADSQRFWSRVGQRALISLGLLAKCSRAYSQLVSFTSIVRQSLALNFGHAFSSGTATIGSGGEGDLPFQKSSLDYAPTDIEVTRNALEGVLAGIDHLESSSFWDVFLGLSHLPKVERCTGVVNEHYVGPVYNFEVQDDHSYVADGLVVHNCKHCKRLYLGGDGQPRIFQLTDLEANGTNVGRKSQDWLPVIGATHPHCQCQIIRIPAGWGFDISGDLVPGGDQGERVKTMEQLERSVSAQDELHKAHKLQGHTEFQGIPIAIENRKGTVRRWTDAEGNQGETRMQLAYGYIKRTGSDDAEEIDVYLGGNALDENAHIIHQNDKITGRYDECKVFLAVGSATEAKRLYLAHVDDPRMFGGMTSMRVDQFKRWLGYTEDRAGHSLEPQTKLVIPLADLEKGEARGGKYFRREPYTDGKGKQRYRYFYKETAAAREAKAGAEIKLGKRIAKVIETKPNGDLILELDGKPRTVTPDQWHNLLTRHYGQKYLKSSERRAQQTINAVFRLVPKALLQDLAGTTDAQRLKELKAKVPKVYDKLKAAFRRAGVSPFQAKRTIARTLERRGWEAEARALVIGSAIRHRQVGTGELIRASESLAGGRKVQAQHVAAVIDMRAPRGKPEAFADSIKETAQTAERELAALSSALAKAKTPEDAAQALAGALSAEAIQKLNLLTQAFPGIQDKAAQGGREVLAQVGARAPRAPTTEGAETTVYVAGDGGKPVALKARYRLVEAKDAIASHNPDTFGKRPDYPEDVQERAYHRDKAEQAKVIRNAQQMNPQFVINTNPDAVNGPPMVTDDGIVLGGNSRVMSMQRVYTQHPGRAKELRAYLVNHAHEVGLTSADVNNLENPILIREVVTEDKSKKNLQLLVRQMNETFTQGMDPRTMQVALGRRLSDQTLQTLAGDMEEDETLTSFLADKRSERFVASLFRAGVIDNRNVNQYMKKGTQRLNQDGVTLVSRILVGRTVQSADILSDTGAQMMESIARSVPAMVQAKQHGEGYDLGDSLSTAVDAFNDLQRRVDAGQITLDPKMSADKYTRLQTWFQVLPGVGESHPVLGDHKAQQLLEVLVRKRGPVQMSKVFREYANQAAQNPEGQATLFGPAASPEDILTRVVDQALGRGREEKLAASMPAGNLEKAGPFIGPRGGKWADAKHTIPWKESSGRKPSSEIPVTVHPKIGGGGHYTFHVVAQKGGNVTLSRHQESTYGPTMPKESVKHFVNDLAGRVVLPKSGNPDIDAVISGKAEFLGKGDDGLAFKVGDKVVKVSTTVPFQPENPGHRSPGGAVKMLKGQVAVGNLLADKGIEGIQRSKFVHHGDKGFQIKGYVQIPDSFTREQLDGVQDTLIAIHKAGYALNDQVQPGINSQGKVVMFDVGKADKIPAGEDPDNRFSSVTDDMGRMKMLYQEHGQEFVRRDFPEGKREVERAIDQIEKWMKINPKFAHKMVRLAAEKRVKELKSTLSGKELDAALDDLDNDLWVARVDLEGAGIDLPEYANLEKGFGGGMTSTGNVAPEMAAQTSPAGSRNPGPGTFPNFLPGMPDKPKPAPSFTIRHDPNWKTPAELTSQRLKIDPEDHILDRGVQAPYGDFEVRGDYYRGEGWGVEQQPVRRVSETFSIGPDHQQSLRGPSVNSGHADPTPLGDSAFGGEEVPGTTSLWERLDDAADVYSALEQIRQRPVLPVPEGVAPYTDASHQATERAERIRLARQEIRNRQRPRNTVDVEQE